ncbi:bactofilin family protein [Providencia manganoxydans]|uniref:bactofilin family protein n=1 Tax=Providencia manganoxydans TaxID=2923283 RepID=UPI0034E3A47D
MDFKNLFFSILGCGWAYLLIYVLTDIHTSIVSLPFLITFFIIFYLLSTRNKQMFAKKNKDNSIEPTKTNLSAGSKDVIETKEEKLTQTAAPRKSTSISSSCHISGDLTLDDDIQIFGHVKGSIRSNNGVVTIQKEGVVEGEIYAQTISINGKMKGLCVSEDLDILENGQLDGICQTKNLTIKKGGVFTGTSERTDKKIQLSDVKNKPDVVKLETPTVSVQ